MLDKRLIKAINSENCFVLVGAGPSCEMGYPSWGILAEKTYNFLLNGNFVKDKYIYQKF